MTDPAPPSTELPFDECYRHAGRRAGVKCQRCGRPICPDCMIAASVGFQCPECVKRSGTRVIRAGQLASRPWATNVLVAINLTVFVVELLSGGTLGDETGRLLRDGALIGFEVEDGEWWRLITSGFLHAGLIHVGFNMVILYRLGVQLEPQLGTVRFTVLYFTALLCGSLGALVAAPDAFTVGASGAVFGLMGAAMVGWQRAGINPWQTDIGGLLVLNLVLTFVIPNISIGGHLGGLAGGVAAGFLLAPDGTRARRWGGVAGSLAVAAGAVVASFAVV